MKYCDVCQSMYIKISQEKSRNYFKRYYSFSVDKYYKFNTVKATKHLTIFMSSKIYIKRYLNFYRIFIVLIEKFPL